MAVKDNTRIISIDNVRVTHYYRDRDYYGLIGDEGAYILVNSLDELKTHDINNPYIIYGHGDIRIIIYYEDTNNIRYRAFNTRNNYIYVGSNVNNITDFSYPFKIYPICQEYNRYNNTWENSNYNFTAFYVLPQKSSTRNRQWIECNYNGGSYQGGGYRTVFQNADFGYSWQDTDSTVGGGGGDSDNSSDYIDYSTVPTLSLSNSILSAYNITREELQQLGNKLWTDNNFFETLKKNWSSPFDNIISLHCLPLTITDVGDSNIIIGNYDSGISSHFLLNDYTTFDCGSIDIKEYWGNALDYDSKLQLYLPFIGNVNINPDDVMNGAIGVRYNINILTGGFICEISCKNEYHNAVLYSYGGNMAYNIPLSGTNYMSLYGTAITSALGLVTAGSSGVALASGLVASGINIANSKPTYERCSNIGGNNGFMGKLVPYLVITRPIQQKPNNYQSYVGYPSYITSKLQDLHGYTVIDNIKLNYNGMLEREQSELMEILTTGFYIS